MRSIPELGKGFVAALVAQLGRELCIDTSAVFATGFSNGAMMAYEVALHMPQLFAAVAPVAGGVQIGFLPKDEWFNPAVSSSLRVPVLDIHGSNDTTMPYNASLLPSNSSQNNLTNGTARNPPLFPVHPHHLLQPVLLLLLLIVGATAHTEPFFCSASSCVCCLFALRSPFSRK